MAEQHELGSSHRLAVADGLPYDRGVSVATQFQSELRELHGLLFGVWFSHLAAEWEQIAEAGFQATEQHCPTVAAEMQGMASVLGRPLIGMLYSEREIGMLNALRSAGFECSGSTDTRTEAPADCTGMVCSLGAGSLLAHANDLTPDFYLNGRASTVLRSSGTDAPTAHCLTFAGVGAIAGMNHCGLAVSRFTVDNGERALTTGVPIYALIREVLSKPLLSEAIELLRDTPRTIPYAYHLIQGQTACCVECSPSNFTVKYCGTGTEGESYGGTRANHCIVDKQMIATEIGAHHLPALGGQHDKSSQARQAALASSVEQMKLAQNGAVTVSGLKRSLLLAPVMNETTMFCFVCESGGDELDCRNLFHVWFLNDDDAYHVYCC